MKKEKEFEVTVLRIAYGSKKIKVSAKNKKEAEEKAIEVATGECEFSEHDADYKTENVQEVEK